MVAGLSSESRNSSDVGVKECQQAYCKNREWAPYCQDASKVSRSEAVALDRG